MEKICLIGPWSSSPKCGPCRKKEPVQKNEKITKKLSKSNEGSKKQTIAEDVNAKMNESGKVKKSQNECKGSCTLLTAKRFNKLLRAGEEAYLAVFLPSSIHKSGSTTKTKLQQMKEKGPVRKAPPNCRDESPYVQGGTRISTHEIAGSAQRI